MSVETLPAREKKVTETIHYVYSDGTKAAKDHVQTLTFKQFGTKNTEDGTEKWGDWTPDQSFQAVMSPVIKGYRASLVVTGVEMVSHDSQDLEKTVTYAKNAAAPSVEQQIIHETIHYIYPDGTTAAPDQFQQIKFIRKGQQDLKTGKIKWDEWSPAQELPAITSPTIHGYKPDHAVVKPVKVNHDSANIELKVTYYHLLQLPLQHSRQKKRSQKKSAVSQNLG